MSRQARLGKVRNFLGCHRLVTITIISTTISITILPLRSCDRSEQLRWMSINYYGWLEDTPIS